jgi:hypothetical protein
LGLVRVIGRPFRGTKPKKKENADGAKGPHQP